MASEYSLNSAAGDRRWLLVSIFLLSSGLLAFEIALTRLLSVLISYHYVFAVLSLALLGQGLGALYLALRLPKPVDQANCMQAMSRMAVWFACSIALSVTALILLGYAAPLVPVYLAISFVPFFIAGIFLAEAFRFYSAFSSSVYGADLLGAGSGCIGVVILLQCISPAQSLYVTALVVYVAGLLLLKGLPDRRGLTVTPAKRILRFQPVTATGLVLLLAFCASLQFKLLKVIPVGQNPDKEIADALHLGHVEHTSWSAFGQTDLISYPENPDRKDMYIDGTAGTPMYRFNGNITEPNRAVVELTREFPGYYPLQFLSEEEKDSVLIIGPGGGRDLLLTLVAGFKKIEGVEVNSDFVSVVEAYGDFNGKIYTDLDNVEIVVAEGRSYLKRSLNSYDLIMLSLPATNSSRSREGIALTENFLLTGEAIEDYLGHLTPEGRLLVVTHGQVEALRLLTTIVAASEKQGLSAVETMKRIVLIGHADYPVLILSKQPLEADRMPPMALNLQRTGGIPAASYLPHVPDAYINPALAELASGDRSMNEIVVWAADKGYDIAPAFDDKPFFFKFAPGLPEPVRWILTVSILLLIIVSSLMTRSLSALKIKQRVRDGGENRLTGSCLLSFSCLFVILGAGFMIVEISLAQRCFLFIGHPILSITVLLFSLLGGAGLGGALSYRRAASDLRGLIAIHLLVISCLLMVLILALPAIFEMMLGAALTIRLMIVIFSVGLSGIAMGYPFPLALRLLRNLSLEHWIPWMLGLNGIGSVFGSALCTAVAVAVGITKAMWLGVIFYFLGFCIFRFVQRRLLF